MIDVGLGQQMRATDLGVWRWRRCVPSAHLVRSSTGAAR